MRVLVTGGTGFVGAHSVQALVAAGHDVRLLVRSPARIAENLGPLGVPEVDFAVGDMTDADAVGKAMDGCDAVLHGAAVVALDRRRADEILAANPSGARVVVGTAVERGLDPIVYVSSAGALFSPGIDRLHADLPPAGGDNAYGRSKAAAEQYVRGLQDDGAPIAITYPGGVIGPPAGSAFGEFADSMVTVLRFGLVPLRDGSLALIDARDLGAIHAAALQPGRGPRRYMCGGHFLTMPEYAALLSEVTGRSFPVVPTPAAAMRGIGRAVDAVTRVVPIATIFTAEAMSILTHWVPSDDGLVETELGVSLRPAAESVAAALRGLYDAGRVSSRLVGSVAATAPTGKDAP